MRHLCVCLTLLFSFVARPARAEPGRAFALHWTRGVGAESCIDPRTLARKVEDLTGPALVSPSDAAVTLEASVAPHQRGFRARVFRVGPAGDHTAERVLSSPNRDCRQLDAVVAFVLALAIDPALASSRLPPELLRLFGDELSPEQQLLDELDRTPPVPAPVRPAEEPAPLAPAAPVAASERTHYALGLHVVATARTLPATLFGGQASLAVDFPRVFPLLLTARSTAWSGARAIDGPLRARFRSGEAALQVCPLGLLFGRVRIRGCAGAAAGLLRAEGDGFDSNRSAKLWDAAAVASVQVWLRITQRVGVVLELGGRLRVLTSRFQLALPDGERAQAVQPRQLGGSVALGPIFEF